MVDVTGKPIGAARPKLLVLSKLDQSSAKSPLLLVGGRPGLYLWLSMDAGRTCNGWIAYDPTIDSM
eukprot:SAG31_NODE_6047_length_2192_cov_3.823220_3_plen_66_part_00